ncbi:BTB/POZ domain-containing protein [Nymphaea thermarum]|nr:BTB/POZ domain-containing protein [Nymphaea thermarum]
MAYELKLVAEKYQVKHLKAVCEKFITSKVNNDNAVMSFAFAHQHNAKHLMEAALSLIIDNMHMLTARDEYWELRRVLHGTRASGDLTGLQLLLQQPQVSLNLKKRLDSRCRERHLAIIDQGRSPATQYNLRSAKGKGVAHSDEMGTSQGQEDLTEMVNKLVTDVTTHEEALGNAAESFGEMKDEMKVQREQVANLWP